MCVSQLLKSLTPEENSHCQHGLYFEDGQRRVDYILTYHLKKAATGRSIRHSAYPLIENAVARSLRRGPKTQDKHSQHGDAKIEKEPTSFQVDLELGSLGETFNSQEDQKMFKREEFEGRLRDMGLELEKDEEVSIFVASLVLLCGYIFEEKKTKNPDDFPFSKVKREHPCLWKSLVKV